MKTIFYRSPWVARLRACPDYVRAALVVWADSETLFAHRKEWSDFLFQHRAAIATEWMSPEERVALAAMPNPLRIYRGYNRPNGQLGFSLTLDTQIAAKMPTMRFRGTPNPWVVTAEVNPKNVIAYLDRIRKEQEIVIDPADIIRILDDQPVR